MRWLVDLVYLLAALLSAPIWVFRMARTGKIRTDWKGRFGYCPALPKASKPRLLIHAVSVGEVNAIRMLVDDLAAAPVGPEIVIAATTDTGFARASELWSKRHHVVRYPFDFSPMVNRFLDAVNPSVTALVELEVWPNFTAVCRERGIPIAVVNGRLTERSHRRYRWVGRLIRPTFQRLSCVGAQNRAYADRFLSLGVNPQAIHVTGTMKWDTAQIADDVPGAMELAADFGIDRTKPLVVAGSTSPEEHALLHASVPPGVQLLCTPRKPEWFDKAASDLPGCVRRSATRDSQSRESTRSKESTGRFLLDTMGELRKAYALADVVVIGRSFGTLHGSDMMEPVALGKPVVVGPAVTDFQDTVDALLAGDGILQTTAAELPRVIDELLAHPKRRAELARNGRAVIRANQGATQRTVQLILNLMNTPK